MRLLSRILITAGFALLAFGGLLIWQRYSPKKLEFDKFSASSIYASAILPRQIIITSIKVNLPIYPAQIKGTSWEATSKGASYLISSPVPGDIGNSIIYGHNWTSLLGPLTKIKPGDRVEIVFDNYKKKTFVVEFTSLVAPSETRILARTSDSRITLYTCAGFLDSKRFVATAILE